MAENQARKDAARNEARSGVGQVRTNREGVSGAPFEERETVAWRSLDRVMEFYEGPADVAEVQPRD